VALYQAVPVELEKVRVPEPCETILVDNGSTDETQVAFTAFPEVKVIYNENNQRCTHAWNQGLRAARGTWIGFLSNDIVLASGWLEGLLYTASQHRLDIVDPIHLEGELDYDLDSLARDFCRKNREKIFVGFNACCFLVRKGVFAVIGEFDERFEKGKYEDSDFVLRALAAGLGIGLSRAALIHHYGSRTVQAVPDMLRAEEENRRRFMEKWGREPDFKKREFRSGIFEDLTLKSLVKKRKAYSLRKGVTG
jgi:GT2 family glycosyltransferase